MLAVFEAETLELLGDQLDENVGDNELVTDAVLDTVTLFVARYTGINDRTITDAIANSNPNMHRPSANEIHAGVPPLMAALRSGLATTTSGIASLHNILRFPFKRIYI